ncbi:MAG: ATP-binding cassette domain-containing protein [Candidatus Odinarchaeum yellowstonii]|uniref:ATP-binding cassette domain-containing protein n=1 Tax=Odinarchaeota yellowstonii (strain LCB_4) TaxID=1841599 RepID=A0AAF0D1B4_ODILC|nr:MAG: ATP-binding cassette domain-containing protein [Candidatus Odinarchaeum yellowstonii]
MSNNFVVELENVYYIRDRRVILRDITWRVSTGERWVILGENGAGKTTLLKIISGYIWPSKGVVKVLGNLFGEINLRNLRRRIGFVSPDLLPYIPTAESFLQVILSGKFASFGLYDKPLKDDLEYAGKIIDFLDCSKIKYEAFSNLSRGEQQRSLIGRALMANPSLLLLDEPCQGLDLPSRERMLSLIDKLSRERRNITIILVVHNLEEIPISFTHALLLKKGGVMKTGRIEDVLTSENISELYNYPLKVKRNGRRFFAYS